MAYENLCMYCFKELNGESVCPHCGGDSRAAVPQVQMLPGTLVYHDRFLVGRALGQDSSGIVYNALDTKRGGVIRIREYLPRNCAERLNDGGVVPIAGMEDAFETGMRKLRASVESVEDPAKRHFYFEENGTAYIAQRKGAGASSGHEREDGNEDDGGNRRQIILYIAIAAAVVLAVAIGVIVFFNSMGSTDDRTTVQPLSSPSSDATWAPKATPTATPYATPTFAALVDPELSWMDYTAPGAGGNAQQRPNPTATQKPTVQGNQNYPTVNGSSNDTSVRELQQYLVRLGWLSYNQVTGKYDSATKEAVRAFQHYVNEYCSPAEKLAEDGIAGKKTQQWLYNSSVSLSKPTATPTPKVTARPNDGTIGKNSSAREIRDLQNKLITLGLMPSGSADGKFGSATQTAVKNFQRRVNQLQGYEVLPVNGTADALTRSWLSYYAEEWSRLHQATATPKVTATPKATVTPKATSPNVDASSSMEAVSRVQKLLQQVGLLAASDADGVYGIRTADAVRTFQEWINQLRGERTLSVSGVVDPLTMRYLEYCVENGRMYDLPTNVPATEVPATQVPATQVPETQAPTFEPEPEVTEVPPEQQAGGEGVTPDSPVESIEFLQEMLNEIGLLDASRIDGDYGSGTVAAVRAFQQYVNDTMGDDVLAVTGLCDANTLRYLQQAYDQGLRIDNSTEAPTEEPTEEPSEEPTEEPTEAPTEEPTQVPIDGVAPESPEDEILDMQRMLSEVQLLDAELVNGVYGVETENAVLALQRAVNAFNKKDLLELTGMCDSRTLKFLQTAAERGMDLRELGGLATPEPTEAPTPVPTEEPTPEPTEEPTPEPTEAPVVGTISGIGFTISGQSVGGTAELIPGEHHISWAAEGDVQSYSVYLFDGSGNQLQGVDNSEMTGFDMNTNSMTPGEVYELRIGALPTNGTPDDIYWQSLYLTLPIVETPEPTEAPTPVPSVSAPVINIGSSVYQQDGVPYINESTAIFTWMADGPVESYTVNLSYEDGTSYSLGTITDTSKTVNTDQLQPGLYRLYVGATPVGGNEDSTVWNELIFGIPAPAATEVPEPEVPEEPEEPETPQLTYLDANSAPEDIQTVQMALYRYGLLDAQSVQAGALDAVTLEAVAAFQQRVNDSMGMALSVIDPSVDQYVDQQTLELLLYRELDLSA